MEKKTKAGKVFYIIYIVIFFAALSVLSLGMLVFHADDSKEKRQTAALPKLTKTETGANGEKKTKLNLDYFDQLSDYFTDHFAFRQELTTMDAKLKSALLHSSNQDRVVLGKEGWLFYEASMHDYLGQDVLSDRGVYAASRVLYLLQENCEINNRKFLFVCAPNKNSLYGRYMPGNYIRTDEPTNFEMLRKRLDEAGVVYEDLHAAFLSDPRVMYHKQDSHWNNEGATFAVDLILDRLEIAHYDYENEPFKIEREHRGDLYNILYPASEELDENVIYDHAHSYRYVREIKDMEDPVIMTSCAEAEGSLLMFRDSYGNATIPYIADCFGKGFFSWGQPVDIDMAQYQNANVVIYEIVERNIPWLIEYLPYMVAPVRDCPQDAEKVQDSQAELHVEEIGNRYVIYGTADQKYTADDSRLLVRLTADDGTELCVEATPASYKRLDSAKDCEYTYGAYIDKTAVSGGFTASLITEKNGQAYEQADERWN